MQHRFVKITSAHYKNIQYKSKNKQCIKKIKLSMILKTPMLKNQLNIRLSWLKFSNTNNIDITVQMYNNVQRSRPKREGKDPGSTRNHIHRMLIKAWQIHRAFSRESYYKKSSTVKF